MEFRHIFQRITKVLRITETSIDYCTKEKHPLRVFFLAGKGGGIRRRPCLPQAGKNVTV